MGGNYSGSHSESIHVKFSFDQHLFYCMEQIRKTSETKHLDPSRYINSVENLFHVLSVYLLRDKKFYDELNKYNKLLEREYKSLIWAKKEEWIEKHYPLKYSAFLYISLFSAMERYGMLPREKWEATI